MHQVHHQQPMGGQGGAQGNENGTAMYCAIAHTQWGAIPGKVPADNMSLCLYPYGGQEHQAQQFEIVYSQHISDATEQVAQGNQNGEEYWCCVVDTPYGRIPGKAAQGGAWYGYAGQEHQANNGFLYVNGR